MRISRFYVDLHLEKGAEFELPEDVAHHLVRVLRAPAGSRLQLFNGRGQEYEACLTSVTKRSAQVRCDTPLEGLPDSPLDITLCQAVSKGERLDYAIQKATELGVTRIQLLQTERVDVRLSGDRLEKKLLHWQRVAVAAAEQCGRSSVPPVLAPAAWPVEPPANGVSLLLDPTATTTVGEGTASQRYAVAIGPEGGFSDREVAAGLALGWRGVRLGPRVLRTETAAPTVLAVLQAQWGDLAPAN
ncbi:MAG: 16S rRNA (uracil(1498)-N(3))-methyltransferase [Pseudomonadota bacterium]|nr:16S rRNA (uracil(1498)-N(3))-methyltransferase [Pseudomonadota bacterium]